MVRWVNAQDYHSPISDAIGKAAAVMYGDTLTPALKRAELEKANRENEGANALSAGIRDWASAASGYERPNPTTLSPISPPPGREDFLRAITPLAADAGARTGLDPRLIVAQAALESNWGQSAPGNNFFGIKSHGRPGGNVMPTTEVVNGQPVGVNDSFRAYPDMASSVNDYVAFLSSNPRYADMFAAQGLDAQVAALASSGYATDPAYGAKIGAIAGGLDQAAFTGGNPAAAPVHSSFNPSMIGNLYAEAVRSGMNPSQASELVRGLTATFYGAENQATTDAFVGAGGNYAATYGGFAADQNRQIGTDVRGQDIASADRRYNTVYGDQNAMVDVIRNGVPLKVRKVEMQPGDQPVMSDSEVKGNVASNMDLTPEQQLAYIGAEPKNAQQADSYVAPDGQVYPSIDGLTNAATGQPLPQGSIKTTITAQDRAGAGLDKINARNVEQQIYGLQQFSDDVTAARSIAEQDPTLFGWVGSVRRAGQNLGEQWGQFSAAFPQTANNVQAQNNESLAVLQDIEARGGDPDGVLDRFFTTEFDPNLSAIEVYAQLLPYSAAAAIAQQTGRGLSDQDVRRFQTMIGDPGGLWATQQGFLSKLDQMQAIISSRVSRAQTAFGEGVVGQGVSGGQQPVANAPALSDSANATNQAIPTPQDVATMSPDQLTNILTMDVDGVPTEVLEPFLDAVARRQQELGIR